MTRLWHLLFLPHPKNNHKAFLIQPGFLGLFIALYLLNQSFIRTFTMLRPGVLGYSSEITAAKVLTLTNAERQRENLPILVYNSKLEASATKKAQDMFAKNYWAHSAPDGTSPWSFFKDADYQYTVAGENLARDFYDTETMFQAWMNSKTHRDNIVDKRYQEIGIGVVNGILGGVKTTLVVQHFGTPVVAVATLPPGQQVLPATVESGPAVKPQFTLNPLLISKVFGGAIFMIIMVVLVVDAFITLKNKTHRLSGSATSHLGFIAIIFLLLLFSRQGTIF
ncbi:MAG: CAP domain-containing protein [Candidatus Shapirobacteria bacterium]|jgi:uncharacterized protein YkwD